MEILHDVVLLSFGFQSGLVLFVADLLHPFGRLTVELFLNGDMGHGRSCYGAMPCFSLGEIQTTSPGRISSIGPFQRCTRPQPDATIRVWSKNVCINLL
jgi:hypothetical protein